VSWTIIRFFEIPKKRIGIRPPDLIQRIVLFVEDTKNVKDRTEVDDTWTELDENERRSPSNASAEFIKEFCLTTFYTFLGVKLSSYVIDVWL